MKNKIIAKRLRGAAAVALALTLAIGTVGCGSSKESSSSTGDTKDSGDSGAKTVEKTEDGLYIVRMAKPTSFMTNIIADAKGFFEEEGIKLEFVGDTGKVSGFQLIEQDLVDAVYSHPDGLINARLQGVEAVAVVPDVVDNERIPHMQYIVNEDSDIQSLDDVGDATFAINGEAICTSGYPTYYLQQNGLENNIEWSILSTPGQAEQSVVQNQVDVVAGHPPYAGKILAEGGVRRIGTSWDIFQSPGAGLYTIAFSEQFVEDNPDVVQRFSNAMYKTRLWVNANLDESKEIVADFLSLDTSDISSFYYDENKNITPDYIDQWIEIGDVIELWDKEDVVAEELYTNEFVPESQPELEEALEQYKATLE